MYHEKVFGISYIEIVENEIGLIGRAYEDFNIYDKLYVKKIDSQYYIPIKINRINLYKKDMDFLCSGTTGALFLDWNEYNEYLKNLSSIEQYVFRLCN